MRSADAVGLGKARRIPKFSRKVAITGDAAFIHFDVAALAFHGGHEEAQSIGTILVNQAKRIDGIALGLRHFAAVCGADEAVQIERLPRHFFHEVNALHRHARVPEEQYVKTGNKHVIGIMAVEFGRLVRPAQCAKWPKRG